MSFVEENNYGYYLPHHAVVKSTSKKTKVRAVFDASAKANDGKELNDVLMVGPTIQDKLFKHLLKFRSYKYIITADIKKMDRQIWVMKMIKNFCKFSNFIMDTFVHCK